MMNPKVLKRAIIATAISTAYLVAYALLPRLPAANLAYFVYSEDARRDALGYYFLFPAYRIQKGAWALLGRPFLCHNRDRTD